MGHYTTHLVLKTRGNMAIEVYLSPGVAEVHITLSELKKVLDVFGGPLIVRLMRPDLIELTRIWDALPDCATGVRFPISRATLEHLNNACFNAGIALEQILGDGTPLSHEKKLPRI